MKKRILAMALTAAMMLSLFPASVFALPESQLTAASSEIAAQLNESASGDSQPTASENTNSETTAASEKAASSEAASSEAASSEAASSEAASSEAASSEAAPAEGDISVASENGERGMAKTIYKYRWVYLYTKIDPSIQISGSEINKDAFYTLGRVKVSVPDPQFWVGPITKAIILERAQKAAQSGKVERWSKNGSIDLKDVDFTELKRVEYGATDYVDSGWTWHLDGVLNTKNYGAVTVQHINDETGKVYKTETAWYKAGTKLTFNEKDKIDPGEGYEFDRLDTKEYTVLAQTSETITYHYKAKQAQYFVCYVDENDQSISGYDYHSEAKLGSKIEAEHCKKDIPGYVYQKADPESLTITEIPTSNVLKLTYKKCTELVATSITNYPAENIVYDGQEHKWEPEVKDKEGKALVENTDYTVAYNITQKATPNYRDYTDVCTIKVTITGKGNYTGKVEYTYSITPRKVTLTSETASKVYDGTPLTKPTVKVEGDGFVEGEAYEIMAHGTVTEVKDSPVINEISYKVTKDYKGDNYIVTYNRGTLTITGQPIVPDPDKPETDKDITISDPKDFTYDGQAHKWVPEVKDKSGNDLIENTDYTVAYNITQKATSDYRDYTDVCTIEVTIRGIGNYTGSVEKSYKILPATLKVTTKSDSKTYDGNALTADGTIEGFVNGETATFMITGSRTDVGSSTNTYKIEWNGTAKQGNYTIAAKLGTLTVNARSGGGSFGGGSSSSTPTPAPEQAPTPTPVPVIVPAAPTPVRRVVPAATATPAPTAKPAETIAESEPPKAENEPEVIEDEETPLAPMPAGAWALVNLILMLLTVLASLLMLLGVIGKKRGRSNKSFWRIVSLIPAIAALVAFVLTENMKLPMAMVDRWTLLMVIIAVLQVIVAAMSKKQNESQDDEAND